MTKDKMVGCITDSVNISLNKLLETVKYKKAWHATSMGFQRAKHNLVTGQQPKMH